jgi:hypothetical protein
MQYQQQQQQKKSFVRSVGQWIWAVDAAIDRLTRPVMRDET